MTLGEPRGFRAQIQAIAERRGISNVRVIGSVARGEVTEDSDVDFLVEVEPGRSILSDGGFLVSELIGKQVHVLTPKGLAAGQSGDVISEAVPL